MDNTKSEKRKEESNISTKEHSNNAADSPPTLVQVPLSQGNI